MKQETLSASTFKLYQWSQNKRAWKRVPAAPVYSTVDCTEFETTRLAMPPPACEMWREGEQLRGTCEVPALDPYPSDPERLLGARKKYKTVVTTGAPDINGEAPGHRLRLEVHHRKELIVKPSKPPIASRRRKAPTATRADGRRTKPHERNEVAARTRPERTVKVQDVEKGTVR